MNKKILGLIIIGLAISISGTLVFYEKVFGVPPGGYIAPSISCTANPSPVDSGGTVIFTANFNPGSNEDLRCTYHWTGKKASGFGCSNSTDLPCTTPTLQTSQDSVVCPNPFSNDCDLKVGCGNPSNLQPAVCIVSVNTGGGTTGGGTVGHSVLKVEIQ